MHSVVLMKRLVVFSSVVWGGGVSALTFRGQKTGSLISRDNKLLLAVGEVEMLTSCWS
jgi:hypothetical protein